jgi:hypothetical protein
VAGPNPAAAPAAVLLKVPDLAAAPAAAMLKVVATYLPTG